MPPIIRTRRGADRRRNDPRDGDPYLEGLARRLVLLGGGDARAKLLWEADLVNAIARGDANCPTVLETAGNR